MLVTRKSTVGPKKKKKSIEDTIKTNFGYNCDMEAIANGFNIEYVHSIESLCCGSTERQTNQIRMNNSIFLPDMSENDLIEIVNQIKTNKAVGLDQIRARDIKKHVHILKPMLLQLYNSIFSGGVIPKKAKDSRCQACI